MNQKLCSLLFFCFLFSISSFCASALIKVEIENSQLDTVIVSISNTPRGLPNLFGFNEIAMPLKDGGFELKVEDFISGRSFNIHLKNRSIEFLLYDKDNLRIYIDANWKNFKYTFDGRGSKRNNVFALINALHFKGLETSQSSTAPWSAKMLRTGYIKRYEIQKELLRFCRYPKKKVRKLITDIIVSHSSGLNITDLKLRKAEYLWLKRRVDITYFYALLGLEGSIESIREMPLSSDNLESFFEYSKVKKLVMSFKKINDHRQKELMLAFVRLDIQKLNIENGKEKSSMDLLPIYECRIAEKFYRRQMLDEFYGMEIYNYLVQDSDRYFEDLMPRFRIVCSDKRYLEFLEKKRLGIKKNGT